MPGENKIPKKVIIPSKEINPEADPADTPVIQVSPEEELDMIPDDELMETPPYEAPEPGEGP